MYRVYGIRCKVQGVRRRVQGEVFFLESWAAEWPRINEIKPLPFSIEQR
jgi:hypothetical protein